MQGPQGKPGPQGPRGEPGAPGKMPAIEQVMPWLHLVFDAWEAYREGKQQEAKLLAKAGKQAAHKDKKKKKKHDKNNRKK